MGAQEFDRLVFDYLGNYVDALLVDSNGQYECWICGKTMESFVPVLTDTGWHHEKYPICSEGCQQVMDADSIGGVLNDRRSHGGF